MPITILPEANYFTDARKRIRIYSLHDFVACIDTSMGCTPAIYNDPYHDFAITNTVDHYLKYGTHSEYTIEMKIFSLVSNFVVNDAYLLLGEYTDPDNKKHIIYKIGSPIDVPAIDRVWIAKRNGDLLYGEGPTSESDLTKIGTVNNTFFLIHTDNPKIPPAIFKPKIGAGAVLAVLAILSLAGIGAYTWYSIETHKADNTTELQKYNTDKFYEFLNTIANEVKNDPSLADPYAGIIETVFGSYATTFQMPNNINPHATTPENTDPFTQFINWIKGNWWQIVFPIIGLIILVFKWDVIIGFIKDLLGRFRRR